MIILVVPGWRCKPVKFLMKIMSKFRFMRAVFKFRFSLMKLKFILTGLPRSGWSRPSGGRFKIEPVFVMATRIRTMLVIGRTGLIRLIVLSLMSCLVTRTRRTMRVPR